MSEPIDVIAKARKEFFDACAVADQALKALGAGTSGTHPLEYKAWVASVAGRQHAQEMLDASENVSLQALSKRIKQLAEKWQERIDLIDSYGDCETHEHAKGFELYERRNELLALLNNQQGDNK